VLLCRAFRSCFKRESNNSNKNAIKAEIKRELKELGKIRFDDFNLLSTFNIPGENAVIHLLFLMA